MKKALFIIILLVAIGTGVWYFILRWSKPRAIKVIVATKAGRIASTFESYGDDYLIAWAKAIKAGATSFTTEGKSYSVATGVSV